MHLRLIKIERPGIRYFGVKYLNRYQQNNAMLFFRSPTTKNTLSLLIMIIFCSTAFSENGLIASWEIVDLETGETIDPSLASWAVESKSTLVAKIAIENPSEYWLRVGPLRYDLRISQGGEQVCEEEHDFQLERCAMRSHNTDIVVSDRAYLLPPHFTKEWYVPLYEFNNLDPEDRIGTWIVEPYVHLENPADEYKTITCPFSEDCISVGSENLLLDPIEFKVKTSVNRDLLAELYSCPEIRTLSFIGAIVLLLGGINILSTTFLHRNLVKEGCSLFAKACLHFAALFYNLGGEAKKARECVETEPSCPKCFDTKYLPCNHEFCRQGFISPRGSISHSDPRDICEIDGKKYICIENVSFDNSGGKGSVSLHFNAINCRYGILLGQAGTEEQQVVDGGRVRFDKICIPLNSDNLGLLTSKLGRIPKKGDISLRSKMLVCDRGERCPACNGTSKITCPYCAL